MTKNLKCSGCGKESKQDLYDIRITNCYVCDNWNLSKINWLLVLKMKENGFDWHEFADNIDELAKRGTAKEQLLKG